MNTDIRISVSFKGHRKRRKLKMLIGPEADGCLIDLWISTAMNHPEGILHGLDETDIALEAGWTGDPAQFVNGLMATGFLEKDNGAYRLHDWEDHQPYVVHAPERAQRAKHAAQTRWEKRLACLADTEPMPEACSEHAGSMPDAMLKHESSNAPSPAPAPIASEHPNSDDLRLSELLFSLMLKNNPKAKKPNFQAWAKHVDRIHRIDGRDYIEIEKVIRWSQQDSFWLKNILSPESLRKQFDRLWLAMGNKPEPVRRYIEQ